MGYHPETLAFSFPPYPGSKSPGRLAKALYALKPWIGFNIWHIDPERAVPGQRRDDSCGWFPRNLTPDIEAAVDELLGGGWDGERRMLERVHLARAPYDVRYPSLKRMPAGEGYAMALMYLTLIDRLSLQKRRHRWRRDSETKAQLRILRLAQRLTLNDVDSLLDVESPEAFIRLLAAAYRRDIRAWWKHPRWHVHHWQVNFDLARNLRRMVQPCATCRRPLGFNYCPTDDGSGKLHHHDCLGIGLSATQPESSTQ